MPRGFVILMDGRQRRRVTRSYKPMKKRGRNISCIDRCGGMLFKLFKLFKLIQQSPSTVLISATHKPDASTQPMKQKNA